jgi:Kdo2-lipid IVA lauroyltransferase/acyltransferase
MPFRILYGVSDVFYVLLFYIFGYRKKVVLNNLRSSFPYKTEQELLVLRKKSYRYFCDLFVETFKTLTISKKAMIRHCSIEEQSLALLHKLASNGESVLLVLGHKGNWEWAGNTFSLLCKHQLFVIYHPLSNFHFDQLMYKMRTRFGTKLIAMKDTFKEMVRHRNTLSATAFIADQTPQPNNAHWMTFLHQDTPVFEGTEKIARKLNRKVIFVSVQKVKRGYYTIVLDEKNVLNPNDFKESALTEAHMRKLEESIIEEPETWLWTHRRWKHKRNIIN